MSEIITINTEDAIKSQPEIEPLPLYGEDFPMLESEIPLYDMPLPNESMSTLVKRLIMTMKLYGGIGLSANQCGVFERVFVIGTDQFQLVCINPILVSVSDEISKDKEGCLSYPAFYVTIDRPKSIQVEFMNVNGVPQILQLDGLTARCFLHELDHMNGIKLTDKVGPIAINMARKKQSKIMKQYKRKKT